MSGDFGSHGPQVTIREIKKDSVDFVLSDVDLAYRLSQASLIVVLQTLYDA
jgi:hypothetical protein